MKFIFNPVFISDNEFVFYAYVAIILLIIIVTTIFVIKEIKKK